MSAEAMAVTSTKNDVLIDQCLRSTSKEEARRSWSDLCQKTVWPTVEKVLRRKMGSSFGNSDDDEYNQVACEAFASVFTQFDRIWEGHCIQDLAGYTALTTMRAFGHLMRRKYPQRALLQSEVNHVLKVDPRMDKWPYATLYAVTGLVRWKGAAPVVNRQSSQILESPGDASRQCFRERDPDSMLLPDAMLSVYGWVSGPLELDPVVNFFRVALNRQETDFGTSVDDANVVEPHDPTESTAAQAAARTILQALWDELSELDRERRGIFLLFEPPGSEQDHLLDLLVMNRIASLDDIAEFVGVGTDTLTALLSQERVELRQVAEIYDMDVKRAEGVRKGIVERLARRFEKQGLYGAFVSKQSEAAP